MARTRGSAASPGTRGAAGKAPRQPRRLALGAMLLATLMLAAIAPPLLAIERLAEAARADVLPATVVEQKRAIWTETLRGATSLVVHAPDPTREHLEHIRAVSTASQDLLAQVDRGRSLPTRVGSMETSEALGEANTLRGSAGYRPLVETIDPFTTLAAVFDRQRANLEARDQALEASRASKLQLATLRENLAADAADTAESSVAAMAEPSHRIRNVILVAVGAGVLAVAGAGAYARRRARVLQGVSSAASGQSGEERARREQLARVAELTRKYQQAQANLDYWRDFLVPKLYRTVATVLLGSPTEDEQPDVEAPFAAVAEVRAPVNEPPALPDPLPELIDGIGGELWSVAARSSDAGLRAVADCMAAAAHAASIADDQTRPDRIPAPPPEVDLESPRLSLQATVEAVERVVVQIGFCLSAINALAVVSRAPDPPAETTAPEAQCVSDRLQDLFEELVVARERLGTKARELG